MFLCLFIHSVVSLATTLAAHTSVTRDVTSQSVNMQWVVHVRSDGSRHITRRPAHKRSTAHHGNSHAQQPMPSNHSGARRRRHRSAAGSQNDVIAIWRQNVLRAARGEILDGFTTLDELLVLGDPKVNQGPNKMADDRLLSVTNV